MKIALEFLKARLEILENYLFGAGGNLLNGFNWYFPLDDFNNLAFFGALFYFFPADEEKVFARQNKIALGGL